MYSIITSLINHFKESLIIKVCCSALFFFTPPVMDSGQLCHRRLKVNTRRRLLPKQRSRFSFGIITFITQILKH